MSRGFPKLFKLEYLIAAFLIVFFIYATSKTRETSEADYIERLSPDGGHKSFLIDTAKGNVTYDVVEENVFKRFGYQIVERSVIPKLDYIEQPSCPKVFADWLEKSKDYDESAKPPKEMKPEYKDQYLMYGYGAYVEGYMDDRSGTKSATWDRTMIDQYVSRDVKSVTNYEGEGRAMYFAMKHHGVTGHEGFVVGSLTPWVEAFALKNGAKKVTTMEYMRIKVTNTDRVGYAHPVEVAKDYQSYLNKYDFGASFSSIEHSGLGRFGDVPDPIGDLREMQKVSCMMKKGGLFFLSVPYGCDCMHGNLHRVYGRVRTAMMAAGFDVLNMFYLDSPEPIPLEAAFFSRGRRPDYCNMAQGVLVMRKN